MAMKQRRSNALAGQIQALKLWLAKHEPALLGAWAIALVYPILRGPSGSCSQDWLRYAWTVFLIPPLIVVCAEIVSAIRNEIDGGPQSLEEWGQAVRETIEEHRRSAPRMWLICAILLPLAFYCVAIRYYEIDLRDGSDVRVHDRLLGTWFPIRNEDCVIP
jgi:hypothetical protein